MESTILDCGMKILAACADRVVRSVFIVPISALGVALVTLDRFPTRVVLSKLDVVSAWPEFTFPRGTNNNRQNKSISS